MRTLAWLFLVVLVSCAGPLRSTRLATGPTLEVLTWNVNFGLAGDVAMIDAIADIDADIVLLQETNEGWERAIRTRLGAQYPFIRFRHCCRAGGLAVLSKHLLGESDYIAATSGWFPAWRQVVHGPLGPVQILNLHLRPPVSDGGSFVSGYFTTGSVRRDEVAGYAAYLDPDLPTIVVGDLNENAGGAAVAFLEVRGLRSALPEFHPGANTWRWTTSVGTLRSQLDHVLYGPRLEPLDARVVHVGRSDHLPVVVVFE